MLMHAPSHACSDAGLLVMLLVIRTSMLSAMTQVARHIAIRPIQLSVEPLLKLLVTCCVPEGIVGIEFGA